MISQIRKKIQQNFQKKKFPEDDSADSQTDKAEQTEIEKDPEEPEDEDGREEEATRSYNIGKGK